MTSLTPMYGNEGDEDQEGMRSREEVDETAWLWRIGVVREGETVEREDWK